MEDGLRETTKPQLEKLTLQILCMPLSLPRPRGMPVTGSAKADGYSGGWGVGVRCCQEGAAKGVPHS